MSVGTRRHEILGFGRLLFIVELESLDPKDLLELKRLVSLQFLNYDSFSRSSL